MVVGPEYRRQAIEAVVLQRGRRDLRHDDEAFTGAGSSKSSAPRAGVDGMRRTRARVDCGAGIGAAAQRGVRLAGGGGPAGVLHQPAARLAGSARVPVLGGRLRKLDLDQELDPRSDSTGSM